MRIAEVKASNYLNRAGYAIAFNPDARVVVIAGENEAGKSGLVQAIKLTRRGEPVRDLSYKNELGRLITRGQKDGWVSMRVVNGSDKEYGYRLNLKSGEHVVDQP